MSTRFNLTQAGEVGDHLDAVMHIAGEAGWLCMPDALVSNVRNKYNEMKEKLETLDIMLTAVETNNENVAATQSD